MGALGHYLELEGLATVGISLVREHTAAQRPPRFLWTPFPFGRPLGSPGDAEFQHRVIAATLDLLDEPSGPVLVDFPDDAPGQDVANSEWSCAVSFPSPDAADEDWARLLRVEMRALEPWYDLGRTRRGRTAVGASGLEIADVVQRLLDAAETGEPASGEPAPAWARNLKLAVEDLRAYYLEAVTSQPGDHPPTAVNGWFWGDTDAGALVIELARELRDNADRNVRGIARNALVPRSHMPA